MGDPWGRGARVEGGIAKVINDISFIRSFIFC